MRGDACRTSDHLGRKIEFALAVLTRLESDIIRDIIRYNWSSAMQTIVNLKFDELCGKDST